MNKTYLVIIVVIFCINKLNAQSTVTDIDGNNYSTITIGTQMWMAENLRTKHYNNGDSIPYITDNNDWYNLTTGAYAYYNLDTINRNIYGNLYNGFVVLDSSRNVCPVGWHIPVYNEWVLLELTLCTSDSCTTDFPYDTLISAYQGTDEGGKLKETGTSHWNSPNTGATNSSGFTTLPGGYRYWDGLFYTLNEYTLIWTSTEHALTENLWFKGIVYNQSDIYNGYGDKKNGASIRCVKSAETEGVEENKMQQLNFYPNPSGETITFDGGNEQADKIEIYNTLGALVYQVAVTGKSKIDISFVLPGIYIIKITGNETISIGKLIKE